MANGIAVASSMATAVESTLETLTESEVDGLRAELEGSELHVELLRESLADLAMSLDDVGWSRVGVNGVEAELDKSALNIASERARVMAVANPLIRRGLALRHAYVWGSGVSIGAKAVGGNDGEQDVNAVVQAFLDDPGTRKVLTSSAAKARNEKALGTDGSLFVALFTAPRVGTVQPRMIPYREVQHVVKNPDDRTEVWFYQRLVWDAKGGMSYVYHPDVDYRPQVRPKFIGDGPVVLKDGLQPLSPGPVMWDAPIAHLKVNDLPEWDFGVGDAFSALPWATAYKGGLEDWAKLIKAISRFTWRLTSDRKSSAQDAANRIRQRPATDQDPRLLARTGQDPNPIGQTYASVGTTLEAIPKTGATIDSESFKPIAAMAAAGLEIPVTMLLSDPGVTGARATAETLDKPTELMAAGRRDQWGDFLRLILGYVIDQAILAPQGALKGAQSRDEWGRAVVVLAGDTPRTIDIAWPDLTATPIDMLLKAIAYADGTEKLPPLLIVRLLLAAFNVADSDEWLAEVTDEETGEFVAPTSTPDKFAVGGSGVPTNIAP